MNFLTFVETSPVFEGGVPYAFISGFVVLEVIYGGLSKV